MHILITKLVFVQLFFIGCRANSDIMFPAAGDGCFYVGLGGRSLLPQPKYQPYQCCPSKVSRGSKVAKATPSPVKQVTHAKDRPLQTVRKSTVRLPKPKPTPPPPPKSDKGGSKLISIKEKPGPLIGKQDKPKGSKKGFFGTGKYIWWW